MFAYNFCLFCAYACCAVVIKTPADGAYTRIYPKHGKYQLICGSGNTEECKQECKSAQIQAQYKDGFEDHIRLKIGADCVFDVVGSYSEISVGGFRGTTLNSSSHVESFTINGKLLKHLRELRQVQQLEVTLFYDRQESAGGISHEVGDKAEITGEFTFGLASMSSQYSPYCRFIGNEETVSKGTVQHASFQEYANIDDFHDDFDPRSLGVQETVEVKDTWNGPKRAIDVVTLMLTKHDALDGIEIPEFQRSDVSAIPICVQISYSTTSSRTLYLTLRNIKVVPWLRTFRIRGGGAAEVTTTSEIETASDCDHCTSSSGFWCERERGVQRRQSWFNPAYNQTEVDDPMGARSYCLRDPKYCPGSLKKCNGDPVSIQDAIAFIL